MEKNAFIDSRKLELYFQLELNIKELLEKNSGGFCPRGGFRLKSYVYLCSFFFMLSFDKHS